MKKILLILSLAISATSLAQNQAANWYFGQNAGVNFNLANGAVTSVDNGRLNTREGCTSISDENGALLLYTDGSVVYNRNHTVMQNGTGLYGDASSTQSAIVIPKPQDPNIYYIFTVYTSVGQNDPDFGFNYSIVDMSLDGGLGGVTSKNINLLNDSSEKITAVSQDCQTEAIWVITYANSSGAGPYNSYQAFEVTAAGVNTTPVVSLVPGVVTDPRGQMKVSPDGTKMVSANMRQGLYLYDFDTTTGVVSNPIELLINNFSSAAYGVEFSPNSSLLYVHSTNNAGATQPPSAHISLLTQFDLTAADIQSTEFRVDTAQLYRGSLQLGPDGKIYRSMSANYTMGLPYLSVIHNPNAVGIACNYEENAIDLSPNRSTQGLPPFVQSFFNDQIDIIQNDVSTTNLPLCEGDVYTLTYDILPDAIYTWYKDGVLLPETDHDLVVTEDGTYELLIEFNNGSCDTFEGIAFVEYFENPVASQPSDIIICDDNNDATWGFDFSSHDASVLGALDPNVYSVLYFESQQDADNNENVILGVYNNTSNPQQIFARVHNSGNPNCYDTTSFMVEVFDTPIANTVQDWVECDDLDDGNNMNGQKEFDLSTIDAVVLGTQIATDVAISYHATLADADANSNPLPANYYNTTPFTQTIFVRIENVTNTDCYSTTTFNLIVNPIPEANNVTLYQCDEDGNPDGFTLFNLTEAHDAVTGGTPDRTTKYFLTLADAQNSINEIDGSSFSNTVNPQTIYVQVIDDLTGCFNTAQILLDVTATDAADAALAHCDDDGIEDGFYNFDLTQANAVILNGLPASLTISYYETYDDSLLEQNSLGDSFTNTIAYNQTIYARVENANACYGISEVELTVFELPTIATEDETIYCLNLFPEPIILDAGLINNVPSDFTYSWSTGDTTEQIFVNQPGTYTVTVINSNNCEKERTITVLPSNIATIENIEVVDATSNNTITVLVSGEGDYEFALNDINGPYQDSNLFENVPPGLHTVFIRDKNNCGIVEDIVSVIGFPKFFTPNNDGYNDTWHVYGINDPSQYESIVYIFDRYGKLLKQLHPQGPGWDGTFNGNMLPTNDYWFSVKLQDGRIFKSHFTLKR